MDTVPTFSPSGWVTNPADRLLNAFIHICTALEAQSTVFFGDVYSLGTTVAKTSDNPSECREYVQEMFKRSLQREFDDVEVDVRLSDTDDASRFNIQVKIICMKDGIQYNLNKALSSTANKNILTFIEDTRD